MLCLVNKDFICCLAGLNLQRGTAVAPQLFNLMYFLMYLFVCLLACSLAKLKQEKLLWV